VLLKKKKNSPMKKTIFIIIFSLFLLFFFSNASVATNPNKVIRIGIFHLEPLNYMDNQNKAQGL